MPPASKVELYAAIRRDVRAGAGPEFADVAGQQSLFDQMKSAPGFKGHWSGATDAGYRVFEVWESPEATRHGWMARSSRACPQVQNQ